MKKRDTVSSSARDAACYLYNPRHIFEEFTQFITLPVGSVFLF